MIIDWTSGDKGREIDTGVYYGLGFVRVYHTGSGGAVVAAIAIDIREVPKEWGIQDPIIARAFREQSDRINRIINKLGELV